MPLAMATQRRSPLVVSKIGIIGAGVSGIAAAKQLRHYNPVVFEAANSIGGVWKTCSYRSTKLQTYPKNYEFSDFPWPNRENLEFPSYSKVLHYLEEYAKHFDVLKHVRFNSKVVEIRYIGDQTNITGEYPRPLPGQQVWEVAVQTNNSQENVEWYGFEFLIICTGKYGDIPNIPIFPQNKGPEVFSGKVLHTLDYCKLDKKESNELFKGKKVVVVGFKKSSIDLAVECAEANQGLDGQPCTILLRTIHWTLPHYSIWGLPFFLFYSTRFSQLLHETPNQSFFRAMLCYLLSPMRRGVSMFIESYLQWKLPLKKYGLKPNHPFEEDIASCQIPIIPEKFFMEADKGKILFKQPSKWWFWKGGIEFDDNTKLDADVVVLATGYDGKKKITSILPEPFLSHLENPSGIMPLYRGTIHPLIPNMAFVGFVESVSNLHTAEIRSIWLARLVDGKFKLPSKEKMLEQTSKEIEVWRRSNRFYERQCITTYSINHSDEMCEEMGWKSLRKKNLFFEAFSPYRGEDYGEELVKEKNF